MYTEQSPLELLTPRDVLDSWLALGKNFKNPPSVTLQMISKPADEKKDDVDLRSIAITTAVQCYSPGKAVVKVRDDENSNRIADSTLDAGHLTTRQHAHMTWRVEATRHAIQSIFHNYPYYNSEQQSQRYVEIQSGNFLMPADLSPEQEAAFLGAAEFMNAKYFELLEVLAPHIRNRVISVNPRKWNLEKNAVELGQKVQKLCQEIA